MPLFSCPITDAECMFKNAMFYGLEETLISFECMIFIIADLACENFTLSAIITFAITQVSFENSRNVTNFNPDYPIDFHCDSERQFNKKRTH